MPTTFEKKYENWNIRKLENYKMQCFEKYENFKKEQNKLAEKANKALDEFRKMNELLKNRYDDLKAIPIEDAEIYKKINERITPEATEQVKKELESY